MVSLISWKNRNYNSKNNKYNFSQIYIDEKKKEIVRRL